MLVGIGVVLLLGFVVLAMIYRFRRLPFAHRALFQPAPRVLGDADGQRFLAVPTVSTHRGRPGRMQPVRGHVSRADEVVVGPAGVDHHRRSLVRPLARQVLPYDEVRSVEARSAHGAAQVAVLLQDGSELLISAASPAAQQAAVAEIRWRCGDGDAPPGTS
ncbi:hypothetical protein GCM10027215_19340 [Nocardioides zeae]